MSGENHNNRYWKQEYNLDMNLYLPKGFSIATDLNSSRRTGLTPWYNINPITWNAGFSRTTNPNYIEDLSYTVLKRDALFSFTYMISRFAGKSIQMGLPRNHSGIITTNY